MFEAEIVQRETVQRIYQIKNWIHIMELNGVRTPGVYDPKGKFDVLGLPLDLSGKTVLDIGCADGYYSFECERRGATVVSVDRNARGFDLAKELLNSKAEHKICDFMDLREERQFDIVLFLGILYHMRHPLLALEKLRVLCRSELYVESEISTDKNIVSNSDSWMKLVTGSELEGDASNWWVPNLSCLQSMLKLSGFDPEVMWIMNDRACVKAFVR